MHFFLYIYSKDRLTIDSQKKMGSDYESDDELSDYTPLAAQDSSELILDDGQLETLSLVCQSKAGVKMLFDSGLLRILSETILGIKYLYCILQMLLH